MADVSHGGRLPGSRPVVLSARVAANSGGGPERIIFNLPQFLAPHGYQVLCAYMHPPGSDGFGTLSRTAATHAVPLISVEDRGPFDVRVLQRLLALCREHDVSIWHAHDYKSDALGWLIRCFRPMKLVSTVQGWVDVTPRLKAYYHIDRRCLREYDRVMCVSHDLRNTCLRSGVAPSRCTVVENAVDTTRYLRDVPARVGKQRLGLSTDRLLVGCLARLSPEKNLPLLVDVVSRLAGSGVNVDLVIAGEGRERAALEALVRRLDGRGRVQLLGHVVESIPLLHALDVFVLPSLREGLPLALLEAMSMGLPVVATRVAGVPALVTDDVDGLLVDPGSAEQLSSALLRLAGDEALRVRLGAAARLTVERRYGIQRCMEQVLSVYDEVLSGHAAPRSLRH